MSKFRNHAVCVALLLIPLLIGFLTGCAQMDAAAMQMGLKESPYYHLGDTSWDNGGIEEYYFNQIPSGENELYRELFERIRNNEDEASLYARLPAEQFWDAYYAVLADHPEFFWIGSNIEVQESSLTGKVVSYRLSVTVPPEEREEMGLRLAAAADMIIGGIPEGADDYRKIKYVYEYLVNTTDYVVGSACDQNAQSALLYHASVCAGYSRAFQYVLHRMGMFCTYVTGRTLDGGDHAWNIVRIGDQYYNVDVTWGDPVFTGDAEGEQHHALYYNYLCCTDRELSGTHIVDSSVPMPACTDGSLDYYYLNGCYFETFDYETIYAMLMDSVYALEPSVTFKFADSSGYEAAADALFSGGMLEDALHYLMRYYGVSSWDYRYTAQDQFRLITIYWT